MAPKEVLLADIWWRMTPFMLLQVAALLLIYFFPRLALWLPSLVYR